MPPLSSAIRPRCRARKTKYVGTLKDGKTRGFWLLLLATPYRGWALPCGFVTYSSQTIVQLARSRNQYHWEAFDQLKALLGDKPLVLDREFSYLELLEYLVQVTVNFVICLHLGSHPPTFYDASGRKITLTVGLGEETTYRGLSYMGKVTVNVVGVWRKGHAQPLWIMSNLAPERALAIYAARMKIEETFRDLKSLLNFDKLMNKSQLHMEEMAASSCSPSPSASWSARLSAMNSTAPRPASRPLPARRRQRLKRPKARPAASGSSILVSSSCSNASSPWRPNGCVFSTTRSCSPLRNSSNRYLSELKSEAQVQLLDNRYYLLYPCSTICN